MRRVFLFWSIILFILIIGAVAIVYSKILLKEEEEIEDKIREERTLPKRALPISKPTVLPTEGEVEEVPAGVKVPELVLPPEAEVWKTSEGTKLLELPESATVPPPLPPEIPKTSPLPEIPEQIDIDSLKTLEPPIIPETLPPLPPVGR